MRKGQVGTTAMDIERVAERLGRHRRALDVPPRASLAPRRLPRRFARLGRLPQREVAHALLVVLIGYDALTAALLVLLAACDGAGSPAAETPLSLEARYRLMYNDTLVGTALFTLEIGADGAYRLDAFTVPAGQMLDIDATLIVSPPSDPVSPAAWS